MTADEQMASIHVLHLDGRVASAGIATIEIAACLPVVGPLIARVGRPSPMNRLVDVSYRAVARNRRHLARFVRDMEPVIRWRSEP
jgi:predicted DCC family thiol-disulfide oxidoreductase YuxK